MIVFPMVGKSSRFFREGFTVPKFMLETAEGMVFDRAVLSFSDYFLDEKFLFITRDDYETPTWVADRVASLGVQDFEICVLAHDTLGQADTVRQGLQRFQTEGGPITIFNIDTFRPNFKFPREPLLGSNWIEVFKGSGDHWSFIRPIDDLRVAVTTEKDRISEYCSDGLYGFDSIKTFMDVTNEALMNNDLVHNELYIAPLYNKIISEGKDVYYREVDIEDIIFCGTPSEYNRLI